MSNSLEITILGCGSSGGVPRVGGDWGACDPENPRNRRSRCSILVDYWEDGNPNEKTTVLVDTSPDLREQLLKAQLKRLDSLLFTHEHADQTHGIDDLRAIAYRMGERIPTYMDEYTRGHMFNRFGYCFETPEGRVHPPILDLMPCVRGGEIISIDGPGGALRVEVLELSHGSTPVLGFKFADSAVYTPDVYSIDETALDQIDDASVWIVDALRYNQSPTHAHLDQSLAWAARTCTRNIILTNMHVDLDYETLQSELPADHKVGYDGMKVRVRM